MCVCVLGLLRHLNFPLLSIKKRTKRIEKLWDPKPPASLSAAGTRWAPAVAWGRREQGLAEAEEEEGEA